MITTKELRKKTGCDSFLKFKRQCIRSADSTKSIGLTRYYYGRGRVVELDIKPEELFMAADSEIASQRKNGVVIGARKTR